MKKNFTQRRKGAKGGCSKICLKGNGKISSSIEISRKGAEAQRRGIFSSFAPLRAFLCVFARNMIVNN